MLYTLLGRHAVYVIMTLLGQEQSHPKSATSEVLLHHMLFWGIIVASYVAAPIVWESAEF